MSLSVTNLQQSGQIRIWSMSPLQTHTHTHIHTRLMALFPGLPGWAGTRKVKPIWILLKQETVSGSGKTPASHHSVFYRPDALRGAQATASKHWRQVTISEFSLKHDFLLAFHCSHVHLLYWFWHTASYYRQEISATADRPCKILHQSNSCHINYKLRNKTRKIEVMELEGHSWPTCSKQPRRMNIVGVVNKLHRQRVFLTTWSTCRVQIFWVQSLGQSSRGNLSLQCFHAVGWVAGRASGL